MKLVELRNKLKLRKPTFTRSDAHKKKRIARSSWRRPKGIQNKMRLHTRGYNRVPSTGYGSPKAVWGVSKEGLQQRNIQKIADFEGLDPKVDGIIISRTLGNRKRIELVNHAEKNGFTVLNIDVKNFKEKVEQSLKSKQARKKELDKKKAEKSAKEEKKNQKADKAEKKEEAKDTSSEKEQEKKEYDKLLTQKGDN